MSRYTLAFLDDHGEALRSELLDCATEAEAINALHDRAGLHRVQLWLEDQTILELPGNPRPRQRHARRTSFPSTHAGGATTQI
ncbi:MAG TPA: hypothetical protein VK801_18285 [Caulobacteraceae bacterium]|nr:hypothetical protein [Caulobacteraceae bacterium]